MRTELEQVKEALGNQHICLEQLEQDLEEGHNSKTMGRGDRIRFLSGVIRKRRVTN